MTHVSGASLSKHGAASTIPLPFVRHERGDVADEQRVVRPPATSCSSAGGAAFTRARSMPSWTVTVRCADAVADEHRPDRLGRADEAVHLAVPPPRQRRCAAVEVDAPEAISRGLTGACSSTARARPSPRRVDREHGRLGLRCLITRDNRHAAARSTRRAAPAGRNRALPSRGGAALRWGEPPARCGGRAREGPAPSPAPGSVRRARSARCRRAGKTSCGQPRPARRRGSSAPACRRRTRASGPLHLEQLHVFQEHVVRVQQRDDRPVWPSRKPRRRTKLLRNASRG